MDEGNGHRQEEWIKEWSSVESGEGRKDDLIKCCIDL